MHNPVAILEKRGINIRNHLESIQDVKALNIMNGKQYRDMITELAGDVTMYGMFDDLTAKYIYLYLVQNFVKHHNSDAKTDSEALIANAFESARKMSDRIRTGDLTYTAYLEDNSALIAGTQIDENGVAVIVRSGRKGEKKDRAIELYKANTKLSRNEMIELFMKELDMSKAGATTYVYNCRKELT